MYCPAELHDRVSTPHDLETMQQAWRNIYDQARHRGLLFKISFTGGEVTANRNFLPLVEWLRENYSDIDMILMTTNGSASLGYYTRLAASVESISFSTHSEFMHESEFFRKARALDQIMIRPRRSFHVNIMDEYWNQDRIKIYQEWLTEHGISHSVNRIDYDRGVRDQPVAQGIMDFEKL